jgi:secreted trypsin-like serine protease
MSRPRLTHAFLLAFAALTVLFSGFAPSSPAAAPAAISVVDGSPALHGSFPYLAFVIYRDGGASEACSGTVVSSNVILTAAHCVVDEEHGALRPASRFRVVTGNVEWGSSERVVSAVSAVAAYPEYTWSGEFTHWGDAAILQLAQPISAPAVKLATSEAPAAGSSALMVGWGKTTPSQSGVSPLLHYGETSIESDLDCAAGSSHFHPGAELCVLDPSQLRSACSGDSGGPLLVVAPGTTSEPLEVGIASFIIDGGCSPSTPQYYTSAALVAPWVASQVAAAAPPPATPAPAPAAAGPPLPRLGDGAAKRYVRAALTEALGPRFQHRRGYQISCEALAATRRSCKVGWSGDGFLYAGWITAFYAREPNKVVWRYSYRVERTVADCAKRRCPPRVFKG